MGASDERLSRREWLAGALGVSLGSVALGACKAGRGGQWDHEADVLVVGSGVGACTAALIARSQGRTVRLIEKASELGGTSAKSAGVLWVPNNFTLAARGIADPREDCLRYMARFSYPGRYNPQAPNLGLEEGELALLGAFYDNAAPAVDALRGMEALRVAEWRMFHLDRPATDYLDNVPENKVPAGRPLSAVRPDGSVGLGDELMRQLTEALERHQVAVHREHRVLRVVQEDSGRVVGIEARAAGSTVSFRAAKGVIFATGGYVHDPELVRLYQPHRLYGSCARETATGDFIAIAGAAGAAMGDLSGAWRTQIVLDEALVSRYLAQGVFYPPGDSMIQVNRYGRRVVNEKRNYNDRTEIHGAYDPTRAEYPNQLLFMVYDRRTAETYGGAYPLPAPGEDPGFILSGDSFASLAGAIEARLAEILEQTGGVRLDPAFAQNLEATVKRYNGFAAAGRDEDFGRGAAAYDREWQAVFSPRRADAAWPVSPYPNVTMHPFNARGPYHAIMLAAGALDTNGGPRIDAGARVLDVRGQPIPGLYGAGNCIASPSREAYYGAGHTLAMSMTFGYIAANSLARDAAWKRGH
jgi:hypothetical protein